MATLLKKYLAAFLLLGLVLWLGWKVLCARDEPLSPEAQAVLAYTPPSDAQLQGNGYLLLMGFNAPMGAQPTAGMEPLGRQILARELQRYEALKATGQEPPDEDLPPLAPHLGIEQINALVPDTLRCPRPHQDCATRVLAARAQWQALLAEHGGWVQRLQALGQSRHQAAVLPKSIYSDMLPWQAVLRAQELALAQATLQLADGQPAQALQSLAQVQTSLTRVAQGSASLLDSMVLRQLMVRVLHTLGDWLRQHPELAQNPAHAARITQLLAQVQLPMAAAMQGETRFLIRTAYYTGHNQAPQAWQRALQALIPAPLQPGRSANVLMRRQHLLQALSTAAPDNMAPALARLEQYQANVGRRLPRACNRWEEQMLLSSIPMNIEYIYRAHDLEGYRRLMLLHLAALAQGVSAADMPAWLASSPPEWRNPYTGQAMQWDAAQASLVFEGRAAQTLDPEDARQLYRLP